MKCDELKSLWVYCRDMTTYFLVGLAFGYIVALVIVLTRK